MMLLIQEQEQVLKQEQEQLSVPAVSKTEAPFEQNDNPAPLVNSSQQDSSCQMSFDPSINTCTLETSNAGMLFWLIM